LCLQRPDPTAKQSASGAYVEQQLVPSSEEATSSSWTIWESQVGGAPPHDQGGRRQGLVPPYSPDLNPIEQAFAKIKH
jgi:hypothetical protein